MRNDHLITSIVTVLLAVTGLAIIAVLVSKQANTPNVFTTFGQGIAQMICTALRPVTGASCGGTTPSVNSTITFGPVVGG